MPRSFATRLLTAGFTLAFVDFLWALVLTSLYGRPAMSVWPGVASVAFGPTMLEGGAMPMVIGLCMHVTTAFTWSAIFIGLESSLPWLRRAVSTPLGMVLVAAVYGPLIWTTMSGVVIPTMTGRPLAITARWFIQLAGHIPFVGLPIVWGSRSRAAT